MKTKTILLLLLPLLIGFSCKKDKYNTLLVKGYVKSKESNTGLSEMKVYGFLYKTGKGMGIIDGSRSEELGVVQTDANGYFTITAKLFDGGEAIKFIVAPANNSSLQKEIMIQLNKLTPADMPVSLEY